MVYADFRNITWVEKSVLEVRFMWEVKDESRWMCLFCCRCGGLTGLRLSVVITCPGKTSQHRGAPRAQHVTLGTAAEQRHPVGQSDTHLCLLQLCSGTKHAECKIACRRCDNVSTWSAVIYHVVYVWQFRIIHHFWVNCTCRKLTDRHGLYDSPK